MSGILSGWRFGWRKRLDLTPFLRLNLSQRGATETLHERLGPVSLSHNIQRRTTTLSIRGTGVRWTKKWGGRDPRSVRAHTSRYDKWTDGRLD